MLSGTAAMWPSLVDNHIMTLIEQLEADLGEIRKRQVVGDKFVSRLSKEVNALRDTGQATQDRVSELSAQIANLTNTMEAMNMEKKDGAAAPASSNPAMPTSRSRHAEHHSIGTPRSSTPDRKDSGGRVREAIRTELVSGAHERRHAKGGLSQRADVRDAFRQCLREKGPHNEVFGEHARQSVRVRAHRDRH